MAPCGYHLDGAAEQASGILAELPGVRVWAIDADGIVVRPGPRLVDGVEAIARALHPEVMDSLGRTGRHSVRLVAAGGPASISGGPCCPEPGR